MTTRSQELASDEMEIDLRTDAEPEERWATVAEAAELAGVSGAAIRRWYRAGRIPTQRADGERGAYLVPMSGVLRLGAEADEQGDDLGDPVVDLNASYWSLETAAARDETAAVRAELAGVQAQLADVQTQLAFLRDQLAEASAGERAAAGRAKAAEAELEGLRKIAAATSSITDASWLDLATNRYESPVRSQGMPAPVVDDEPVPVPEVAASTAFAIDAHDLEGTDATMADEVPVVEEFRPGEHADDLLPTPEKKGRRGRR